MGKPKREKRQNLTLKRVAQLRPPKTGQVIEWDGMVPGLGVRVTAGGKKAYVFQRRFKGEEFRTTIGDCDAWPLEKAREQARELQRFIDKGDDPRLVIANRKAAKALEKTTLADVWKEYVKANKSHWSARHLADHNYLSKKPEGEHPGGILWPLLAQRIGDLGLSNLKKWAKDSKRMPTRSKSNRGKNTAVRQGFVCLRACWRWAYEQDKYRAELAHPDMFRNKDLTNLIPTQGEKKDVLEKSQLKAWFGAVRHINNLVISHYLQCLLLLGCRRGELASLKWTDVDFRWKKILLHDKIEEAGRIIPLPPYVEFLIKALPRENEYVFSSPTSKSGRLEEPRLRHKQALETAEIPADLSLHGLRRSFTTLSEWIEAPSGIIAQIQGHKPSALVEKHYMRRSLDLLAVWHCKFESWVLKQAEIAFDEKAAQEGLHAVR